MTQKRANPAGDDGAFGCLAWRLDASKHTRSPHRPQALAEPIPDRQAKLVHALGPRVLAEFLGEIATATGQPELIADLVEKYAALDPEIVRFVGADRFPPMPLMVIR